MALFVPGLAPHTVGQSVRATGTVARPARRGPWAALQAAGCALLAFGRRRGRVARAARGGESYQDPRP